MKLHPGGDANPPYLVEFPEPSAEDLERIVHVQDILRSVRRTSPLVNENLLSQEADGVCDSNSSRDTIGLELDGPWVLQKDLDVTQLLRENTADLYSCFPSVAPIVFTADQRSQELCVEPSGLAAQAIVSCRWAIVTDELLGKTMGRQPSTNILFPDM